MKLPQTVVDIIIGIAWKALVWAIANVAGVKDGLYAKAKAIADANHVPGLWVILQPEFDKLFVSLAAEVKTAVGSDTK